MSPGCSVLAKPWVNRPAGRRALKGRHKPLRRRPRRMCRGRLLTYLCSSPSVPCALSMTHLAEAPMRFLTWLVFFPHTSA